MTDIEQTAWTISEQNREIFEALRKTIPEIPETAVAVTVQISIYNPTEVTVVFRPRGEQE